MRLRVEESDSRKYEFFAEGTASRRLGKKNGVPGRTRGASRERMVNGQPLGGGPFCSDKKTAASPYQGSCGNPSKFSREMPHTLTLQCSPMSTDRLVPAAARYLTWRTILLPRASLNSCSATSPLTQSHAAVVHGNRPGKFRSRLRSASPASMA
jgi:hypothetical protein